MLIEIVSRTLGQSRALALYRKKAQVCRETYHVNQNIKRTFPLFDQLGGIVFFPLLVIVAEVSVEGFLAPGAIDRVRNGCEGRYRLILSWVFQELKYVNFSVGLVSCRDGLGSFQGGYM